MRCICKKDSSLFSESLVEDIKGTIDFRNEIAHPVRFQKYRKSIESIFKDEESLSADDKQRLDIMQKELDQGLLLLMQTSHQLRRLIDVLATKLNSLGLSGGSIKHPSWFDLPKLSKKYKGKNNQ